MKFIESKRITLSIADHMSLQAIETARLNEFKPIAICILDSAGNIVVQKRMDHCPPGCSKIAEAKANVCIQREVSSRAYGKKYLSPTSTPDTYVRLMNQMMIADGDVACFPGGVLVRAKNDDVIIGAIGVSGAAGDEDEYCALRGAHKSAASDFIVTEPREHSCKTAKL